MIQTSLYDTAARYVGVREVPGSGNNPLVLAMLRLDDAWPQGDSVPWCSAAMNFWAWTLRLPRSKSLAARSWLHVGRPVDTDDARVGGDVVVLWRTSPDSTAGHVGIFAGWGDGGDRVLLLGGNQRDAVSIAGYERGRILGVRRLHD